MSPFDFDVVVEHYQRALGEFVKENPEPNKTVFSLLPFFCLFCSPSCWFCPLSRYACYLLVDKMENHPSQLLSWGRFILQI